MRLTAKALLCQTLVRYTFGSPPVNLFIRGNLWKDAGYPLPRAPPPASTAACLPNSVPPRPRLAGAEELKREWVGDPLLILLFFSSFGVPRARFLTLGLRVSGSFSFLLSPFSFLPSLRPRRLISGKLIDPCPYVQAKTFSASCTKSGLFGQAQTIVRAVS